MRFPISYLIGLVYVPLLFILLLIYFFGNTSFNSIYILYGLMTVVVSIFLFFKREETICFLKGQIFKHSSFFVLGFFIVHFQFYFDLEMGFSNIFDSLVVVNSEVIVESLLMSMIGLISFFLGYLISCKIKRKDLDSNAKVVVYNTLLFQVAAFLVLIYYYSVVNPAYIAGGYNIVDMGAEAKYASVAFVALIFSIIIQKSRNIIALGGNQTTLIKFIKLCGYSTFFLVLSYLAGVLFSGDRGPLMTFPLIYLAGYLFVTKRKFNWFIVTLTLIIAASFFSLLGQARSLGGEKDFFDKIHSAYVDQQIAEKKSVFPPTSELAMSVSALHHVVNMVPEYHDYLYGRLQVQELKLAIPFASKIFDLDSSPSSVRYWNIQNFTTWIAQGDNPTYGNGSTIIGDLYAAFGIIGIVYGMFVLGWFIRAFEFRMYSSHPPSVIWQIFIFVYFCDAIYMSRSSFFGSMKLIVLICLIFIVSRLIFSKRI